MVEGLVGGFTRDLRLTASRLDVFADWQGLDVTDEDRHRFVRRAKARAMRDYGSTFTGFEFGRRNSNTLLARIYDKTFEVERTGKRWWLDIWGPSYDPAKVVQRVEFESVGRG